jgi:hypothetical protein
MTAVVEYGPNQLTLESVPNQPLPLTGWLSKSRPAAFVLAMSNMPVIRKDKVDYYYSQLYVKPQDFLKTLPELIKKNIASGDYASQ